MQTENVQKVEKALSIQLEEIKTLSGINSLILGVCLVDTLAGFYAGYEGKAKGGNRIRYQSFVGKYLNSHKEYLYDIRCNLTHSFSNTVANFMFVDNEEFSDAFPNLEIFLDFRLFKIDKFKADLNEAFNQYFADVYGDDNYLLIQNFEKRMNALGILNDTVLPTVRNLKGKMISHIDDADNLPGLDLKIVSIDPTPIKK